MKKSKVFLLFVFLSIGFIAQYTNILTPDGINESSPLGVHKSEAWYDTGYIYKKQLTIDGSQVPGGSTLNNFPVLVAITDSQLRTTANGGRVNNASGFDIIFTDDAEGTKLSHEIESYDGTTGTIKMWVKVLNLYSGSNTVLYVYYGNSSISSTQENKTDVWSSNYAGVWHLGANLNDSTSNANNGTNVGATTGVAGKVGNGISSNGSSGRVTVANHASLKPSNVTLSAWVYRNGAQDTWGKPVWFGQNSASPYGPYGLQFNNGSDTEIGGQIASDTTSYPLYATTSSLSDVTWTYLASTYNGSAFNIYFNLAAYSTSPGVTLGNYDGTNGLGIGGRYDGNTSQAFLGSIDEVRISNVARTAGWLNTEYYTVQNQGSGAGKFINTVGGEQTFPVPAVSNYGAILVDDTTAVLTAGINSYGASSNGYFRYGISPTYTTGSACSSLPNTTSNSSSGNNNGNYFPRSAQITGLTAGATYVYCFQSTSIGSPGYSSVVSFTLSATSSTACSLFPGSGIANSADSTTVKGFLGTSKMQGTLLYKGTVNGWTLANFHTAVDNQGPTLILIRNSANSKVFGAYAPKSWNSAGSWIAGAGALLFSISDNYKLAQVNYSDYMLLGASSYGPYMGGGGNLAAPNSANLNTSWGNNNNSSYWQQPSSQGAFTYLSGTSTFTPNEVEVYALSVCTAAPPTVTTPTSASITGTSALLGGTVTSAGTQAIDARGICYSVTTTNSNPQSGGTGVTCTPEGGTATTGFTQTISGLTQNTGYSFVAYAHNSVGYGYSNVGTFTTLNVNPTGVDTNSPTGINSYYVTLSGVANPNSSASTGHFRVYTTTPGNCNSDSLGIRYPQSSGNDVVIGADSSPHTFTYTIPPNANTFLEPNTQYWYCSFAINTNGTTGGATVATFTTGDGPASPCDPPASGNLTIPASATCNLNGNFNGVDTGSGTTNTGSLILSTTAQMTIGPSQQVAFGSFQLQKPNSSLVIARGGSLKKGGVFVHDKDGDGILDDKTQYVGSTPSAASEFVRRNTLSTNYNYAWKMASASASVDCNPNNAYTFRTIDGLVTDADNDGYKTSAAAAAQCVGTPTQVSGRTYYKDTSNANTWLPDGQKLSATTDCQDNPSGAPCAPSSFSATAPVYNRVDASWSGTQVGGAVPAITNGYDLLRCNGNCTPSATLNSTASTSLSDSTVSQTTNYSYAVRAKNAAGAGAISNVVNLTTPASCTNTTVYSDNDLDGHGNNGPSFTNGITTKASISSGTTLTINKPADIVDGMFMIAVVEHEGGSNRTVSAPAGGGTWNLVRSSYNGTNTGLDVWYKYASGEGASYAFTLSSSTGASQGFITSFSNVATSAPIRAAGSYNSVSDASIAYTAGDLYLQVGGSNSGSSSKVFYSAPGFGDELYSDYFIQYASNDSLVGVYRKYNGNKATYWAQFNQSSPGGTTILGINMSIKPLAQTSQVQCLTGAPASGWSTDNTDCDDTTSSYYQMLSTGYPDNDSDGVNPSFQSQICSGASLRPGVSVSSGTDCAQSGNNGDNNNYDDGGKWQNITGYSDADNDTYTTGGSQSVCSGSSLAYGYRASASGTADCYDLNANVFPGQTLYFSTPTGSGLNGDYDYDCNNSSVKESVDYCTGTTTGSGWIKDNNGTGVCTSVGSILYCTGHTVGQHPSACGASAPSNQGTYSLTDFNWYFTNSGCTSQVSPSHSYNVACH